MLICDCCLEKIYTNQNPVKTLRYRLRLPLNPETRTVSEVGALPMVYTANYETVDIPIHICLSCDTTYTLKGNMEEVINAIEARIHREVVETVNAKAYSR